MKCSINSLLGKVILFDRSWGWIKEVMEKKTPNLRIE